MTFNTSSEKSLLGSLIDKVPGGYVLVIHGGAGTMSKEGSTPEQQAAYKSALTDALKSGYAVLSSGGDALDAVVSAVTVLEDCPLFNSAKGAVFNVDGKNELDVSVMLSRPPISHPEISSTRRGLGLTLLTRTKNPSQLVRALYLQPELAPHAFLSGATPENIGQTLGTALVDPSYFFTEHRWREHRRGLGLPEEPLPHPGNASSFPNPMDQLPTGTVGAVALDMYGCIVALTSTGGKTNKLVGRVGDTPVMGSGFWAEEWKETRWLRRILHTIIMKKSARRAVGISGTGDGDYFVRHSAASTIANRVKYGSDSLAKATQGVVDDLFKDGGLGGVIALDNEGNVSMPLNCPGMYRGVIRADGVPKTAIFADEELS